MCDTWLKVLVGVEKGPRVYFIHFLSLPGKGQVLPYFQDLSASQSEIHGPKLSESPGLLGKQTFVLHPRPTESEWRS